MKVAFDENIPVRIFELFEKLSDSPILPHTLKQAGHYRLSGERGDESWILRFARDGGQVILSGDTKIRSRIHELSALSNAGMITYFFGSRWNNLEFFMKSAMLLRWWPEISVHMQQSEKGKCWEIPMLWESGNFVDKTPPSNLKIFPRKPK